ncbi:MAG: hypothetical protein V4527_13815 [Pseudomonadota bacterium]
MAMWIAAIDSTFGNIVPMLSNSEQKTAASTVRGGMTIRDIMTITKATSRLSNLNQMHFARYASR